MSFDKTPTQWLENWSENGTDITVPIATFPELTAAEADGATGDIRKIAFAIVEKLYQQYNATAEADRPVKWTIRKSATVDAVRNVIKSQYVVWFETEIGTQELANETSSSPTATATSTATSTATATATSSATATSTATASSTGTSTSSATASTSGATTSASATASSTGTSTSSRTSTSTRTSTSSSTGTSTLSATATATATGTI